MRLAGGNTLVAVSGSALATNRDNIEVFVASELVKLTASDPDELGLFGVSVAIDENTAAVGAMWEDLPGLLHAGSAYIFMRNQGGAGAWGQVIKLTASDAAAEDRFGWSVGIDGATVVVGARYSDPFGLYRAGSAYVFGRDQDGEGAWGEVAKLTASDAAAGDLFGNSVAVSGDIAVVGSVWDDRPGLYHAGSAYVFMRNEGGEDEWGQVVKLMDADAEPGDEFGTSVAICGETVVIGALLDDHPGMQHDGSAYVFMRNEGGVDAWGQVAKLTASDAEAGDKFGISVAISGDIVVVGVTGYAGESAYVFERNSGGEDAWGQVAKLTASDASSNDDFGYSVAISEHTIAVGARYGGPSGKADAGSAYIFMRNEGGEGAWGEVAKLTASDAAEEDRFGNSVAVSGDNVFVGADGDDHSELTSAGSAYLFGLTDPDGPTIFSDGFESGDWWEWSSSAP